MKNKIATAVAAALSLSACDMLGLGRETGNDTQTNGAAEEATKEGNSSGEEEGSARSREDNDRGRGDEEGSDGGSRSESEDGDRSSGEGGVEEDLRRAVRQQQSRLPMRDGPGTVTEMEAEGNRLIVTMEIEEDLGQPEWDQMAAALQRNICGDRNSRRMIDRGAEVVYQVTDSEGQRVNMTTNRCD